MLLAACSTPSSDPGNATPPPNGSDTPPNGDDAPPTAGEVIVTVASQLESGIPEVSYRTARDFQRCRLRLHGVTVAAQDDVSRGDHRIAFPRIRPNHTYPIDILCTDEHGLTHARGQTVMGAYRLSMDDYRSASVDVHVGPLTRCPFDSVQTHVASKGNLPIEPFAPLDQGCYWNPDLDTDRDPLEFPTPEERTLIDRLSSEARQQGMSDHTINTLLSRTAGPETLLSRELTW